MLPQNTLRSAAMLLAASACLLAAPPSLAHEDPGKILGFEPAYQGPGFRRADPSTYGSQLGSMVSMGVNLESWLTIPELDGASGAMDIWGYVSPSGREYAIVGTTSSTVFVEVTNPADATLVGSISGALSGWRDMKTFGSYCYSVNESGGGVQVIDLAAIDSGVVSLAGTVNDVQGNSHNVFIDTDSGFLYRCGVAGAGVVIYDLGADPVNPPNVAFWPNSYVHDLQVKTMPSGPFAGRQLAFLNTPSGSLAGLTILDVTDKQNLVTVGNTNYPGESYSHQGWLSEDLQRFYINDENVVPAPTIVINVSDPASPYWENTFSNGINSSAHNCFVHDGRLFAANYKQGMRIFDLKVSPTHPPEVGFYDTYPADDSSGYSGLWGVYPFLPSGTILGSDRSRGLFVWTLDLPPIEIEPLGPPLEVLSPSGGQLAQLLITENDPDALDESSPMLVVDSPSGQVQVPLVDQGAGLWEGAFPALVCGDSVTYFFQASDDSGSQSLSAEFSALVADSFDAQLQLDFEADEGWTVGSPVDSASDGLWERTEPVGTIAAPNSDYSPDGIRCWVTGNGVPGADPQDDDVDGGTTTLTSPIYDLSGYNEPYVRYALWYFNSVGTSSGMDSMVVRLSNDGGQTWKQLDLLGPNGPETQGGWIVYTLRLRDTLPITDQMRIGFRARDNSFDSLIEAAVDEVEFLDLGCYSGLGTLSCPAAPNSTGQGATIAASGSDLASDNSLTLTASKLPANQFGYFLTSRDAGFVPMVGGSMGNLCLSGSLGRFAGQIQNSGPGGSFSIPVDLTMLPLTPFAAVQPGDTWRFQAWFRDSDMGTTTSNLTNLVSIVFQ